MDACAAFWKKHRNIIIRTTAIILPVVCLLGALSLTVDAKTTYVITDGDNVLVHSTYATDPEKVLGEAGLELAETDFYTTNETFGSTKIEITVQRLQNISVTYCGQELALTGYGESIEALLTRNGIVVDENYQVSPALDTQTYDGMQVVVDHVLENVESYTVEMPFEVVYCDDPSLPEGQEKVLAAGVAGQMLCTDSVLYKNAQEQSRTSISETVLEQPVDQVVARGTGESVGSKNDAPLIGDGIIVLPTGEILTYKSARQFWATAYTQTDEGCDNITATGSQVHKGVVAVDPTVIPYGTRMFIVTNDGQYIYGLSTAEDCGGGVQGNHVDLYFDTDAECWQFGVRDCIIYFLGDANWKDH